MPHFNPLILFALMVLALLTLTSATNTQDNCLNSTMAIGLDTREAVDTGCTCQEIRDQIKWCNCDTIDDCSNPNRCYNVKCCLEELWLPGMPTSLEAGRCIRLLQPCSKELLPSSLVAITKLQAEETSSPRVEPKKRFISKNDLPSDPQWNAERSRWEIVD